MNGTARPSAKLIVGGLALAAVAGPLLMAIAWLIMLASLANAAAAGFMGGMGGGYGPDGGGGAGGATFAIVLSVLGLLVMLGGAVMLILGTYNFLSTFDAVGARILGPGPTLGSGMDLTHSSHAEDQHRPYTEQPAPPEQPGRPYAQGTSGYPGQTYSGPAGTAYPPQSSASDGSTQAYDPSPPRDDRNPQ
ncbi:hypothetical protein GCM10022261_02120 [Brevibacterium daeguense]|uniref:Uncharacterized protein n=1 Tax=Brevibacterium daeguense TaxID=909936 RepID=A0ABP8EFH1_9MICO|nr:hypothetical protein [Brevibacterium daeguense]